MKAEDLSGHIFGRLTVSHMASRHPNGRLQWVCQCSCGNRLIVLGYNLRMKQTRSCGCLKIDLHSKPKGVAARNRIKKYYRLNAKKRNLRWLVTDENFNNLIAGSCVYCGSQPNTTIKDTKHPLIYNGIDRIDNSKEYTDDNVVSCCSICNHAKSDLTLEEFKFWVSKIADHLLKRKDPLKSWAA